MRLLYVIDSVMVPGGAEQSLALLAPEYRDLGVDLMVATLHERPGHQDELRRAGAQLFSVGGGGGAPASVLRLRALIRRLNPDLVHTTLYEADIVGRIAAWFAGAPIVSSLVNVSYGPEHLADPNARAARLRAAQVLDASTARLAIRMHAVSRRVADSMAKRLHYPRDRIDVVPRGRSAEQLGSRDEDRRAAARSMLGVGATQPLVLAVAREEHQKGLDVLLRAMPHLLRRAPDAVVRIAARPGAETAALRRLVVELGVEDTVTFLGTRSDVPELLAAADVFVLPSRREGLPGAVIEAMALEAPIVASDLPEVREVVDSETAVLVPPDDPEGLAQACIDILGDPVAARERCRRGHDRFLQRFTVQATASQMCDFYKSALDDARPKRR